MSIIQGTAKSGGSTSFYAYPIGDSLRFDGSSYLSRTPSTAGNRQTWTWSGWVKRGKIGNTQIIFNAYSTNENNTTEVGFNPTNQSFFSNVITGSQSNGFNGYTSAVFRDLSDWYHTLFAVDTTQSTATAALKVYVNGVQQTFSSSSFGGGANHNTWVNYNTAHRIGQTAPPNSAYWDGYLANIQFIDGQALDPYFFGEFKDNIWVPYNAFSTAGSGTATASDGDTATDSYGTNGFHLTFEDGIESLPVSGYTGNQNAFRDKSHNTNHWKIN